MPISEFSQEERILQEFCRNHKKYTRHVHPYNNEEDMMDVAYEHDNGSDDSVILVTYIEELHKYYMSGSPRLIIYMPEMYAHRKFSGKIIVESHSSSQFYFEIQLAKKTDFSKPKKKDLGDDPMDGDPWHRILLFHDIFLAKEQAIPFVQRLLFCDLFRQRSLMTIDPEVMGAITTQQLRAASGQVFSFRQCVLSE